MLKNLFALGLSLLLAVSVHAQSMSKTLKFDANVPATLKKQMLEDLAFLAQIQGNPATPLHQKVFGQVDGATYSKWFTSRIFAIGKDGCGSGNAVACVIPLMDPNKMWVTKNYTDFDHPQVARVSVIYHEARHSESQNGNWSHGICPTPFLNDQGKDMTSIWTGALLQNQPACDVTPFGSYGSQTILLKNLAKNCKNCNAKVRSDADLFGNDQLGRIVNANAKALMKKDFGMN